MRSFVLIFLFAFPGCVYCQKKNKRTSAYLCVIKASEEVQINGANNGNPPSIIYDITFKVKRSVSIKNIFGNINGEKVKGKLIYKNYISDSGSLRKSDTGLIRLEKNNSSLIPVDNASGSKIITLSFLINDRLQTIIPNFNKSLPKQARLPE